MKKPTVKRTHWNRIHALNSFRRKLVSASKAKALRRATGGRAPIADDDTEPVVSDLLVVHCPEVFSLEENFAGVAEVVTRIRTAVTRRKEKELAIDMSGIRHMSTTGALVLAAVLDLWSAGREKLLPVAVDQWDSVVTRQLEDMGFFDLLRTTPTGQRVLAEEEREGVERVRYLKLRSGEKAEGIEFQALHNDLNAVAGESRPMPRLYAAVTEAMTNVAQHAYRARARRPQWWLTASYDSRSRRVDVVICDLGAGIPTTLPRRHGEFVKRLARNDDAHLIQAAHEIHRTQSKDAHRGVGLNNDIRGFMDGFGDQGDVTYRVVSGRGEYICTKPAGLNRTDRLLTHNMALSGTLIQWTIDLRP